MKNEIYELIDFLLDCCEFPEPNSFRELPKIENMNLRDYAKQELEEIFKKEDIK